MYKISLAFFGVWENFVFCFRDLLTFNGQRSRGSSVPSHKLERNLTCSLSSGKDMMKNLKPNLTGNQGRNKVQMVVKFTRLALQMSLYQNHRIYINIARTIVNSICVLAGKLS